MLGEHVVLRARSNATRCCMTINLALDGFLILRIPSRAQKHARASSFSSGWRGIIVPPAVHSVAPYGFYENREVVYSIMSTGGEEDDTVAPDRGCGPSRVSSDETTAGLTPTTGSEHCSNCQAVPKKKVRQNHEPKGQPTASSSSSQPIAGDTTGPKLRNTCRTCAAAKVKCDKGKPTCSRCQARGIGCEYLLKQRPGRVSGSGSRRLQQNCTNDQSGNIDATAHQPDTSATTSNDTIAAFLHSPSGSTVDMDCTLDSSDYPAPSMPSVSNVASDAGFYDTSSGMISDLNSNLDVGDPLGMLSTMDEMMYSNWMDCDTSPSTLNSWWPFDDTGNDGAHLTKDPVSPLAFLAAATFGLPEPSSIVSSSLSSTVDLMDLPSGTSSSPTLGSDRTQSTSTHSDVTEGSRPQSNATLTCTCTAQALDQLKTLTEIRSSDVPKILAENKQIIESNLAILACASCTNDMFLLMILLMIMTKILSRYASAAAGCRDPNTNTGLYDIASTTHGERAASLSSEHADCLTELSRAWGGNGMVSATPCGGSEEQISSREAVQRVLRELHQVQRLVTQLSTRRKSFESQEVITGPATGLFDASFVQNLDNSNSNRAAMTRNPSMDSIPGVPVTTPLSIRTLDLAEGDVRKSLSDLSAVFRGVPRSS